MIIAFAIIALIIISGLSIGIYALFIPFMQNIGEIQSYNNAYYGAIAATERALLVTKQQQFGFDGSGGRKGDMQRGPISDYSDPSMGIVTEGNNGIQREVQGKTTHIPQEGKGNVPQIFAANDSDNFNIFGPQDTIFIAAHINNTNDPQLFYTQTNNSIQPTRTFISTQRRIPPHIQAQQDPFTSSLSTIDDNIIVLRQRKGIYNGSEFSIIPTAQVSRTLSGNIIIGSDDMHIRSNIINTSQQPTVNFAYNYNPIAISSPISKHITFGPGGDDIENIAFTDIFNTSEIEELYLQYTMTQPPISRAGFIYPFLEYAIASDEPISDTHRYIQGQSNVGKYKVKVQIKKPQNENIQGSNFTIIF